MLELLFTKAPDAKDFSDFPSPFCITNFPIHTKKNQLKDVRTETVADEMVAETVCWRLNFGSI